jgi:hypothetical protein
MLASVVPRAARARRAAGTGFAESAHCPWSVPDVPLRASPSWWARWAELSQRAAPNVPAPAAPDAPAHAALTHHQLFALIAPFARDGWVLDKTASDRARRHLVFRRDAAACDAATPTDTLELDGAPGAPLALTRRSGEPNGLQATLRAEGRDAAALLARVQAHDTAAQFEVVAGHRVAWSRRLDDGAASGPVSVAAEWRSPWVTLALRIPPPPARSAPLEIVACVPGVAALPDDLLAVLGWDWSPLRANAPGRWSGRVRLRGHGAAREREARRKLHALTRHLAATFDAPPARYHERLKVRRWGVLARRALPQAALLVLALDVAAATRLRAQADSPWTVLLLLVPALLLGLYLLRSEQPSFEWPRWPARSGAASWAAGGDAR